MRGLLIFVLCWLVGPALFTGSGLAPGRALDVAGRMHLLLGADADAALDGARSLVGRPGLRWTLPDFWVPITLCHQPSDPWYDQQWHHSQPSGAHMHSEDAWEITRGDAQVSVAVIDTGVEVTHPDFDPARILTGLDTADGDDDPTPGPSSVDAHGTICAGQILASMDNGEGGSGVCPACSLIPIRTGSDGSWTSQAVEAFEFALAQGAWVCSNSWCIDQQSAEVIDMQPITDAVRDLVENGRDGLGSVVLFASANGDEDGVARAIGEDELDNLPEVMAVGGTGSDDRHVRYSNFGPNLSVVAPTAHSDYNNYPGIFTTDTLGDRGMSRGESSSRPPIRWAYRRTNMTRMVTTTGTDSGG